ncbi:MAG TPA: Asp-tRNA(Asn)/Glu-tRNA(Gln) amidotransferase subunit GatC [Phycisphaerae bacterium]|nr:Asp-tRNA(Asn)/Glu-tRNA(Gln) amidotransferase subunit GatC [Phycisphaerae bacterium]
MAKTPESTDKLDEAQVRHVAKLARLKLADADIGRYATQLTGILGYVAQLKSVDVSGPPPVEPMAHPLPLENVLRADVVEPSLTMEQVLANAPAKDGPYFAVPKVLDNGMGGG